MIREELYRHNRRQCCPITGLNDHLWEEHVAGITRVVFKAWRRTEKRRRAVLEATPANPPSGRPGVASSAAVSEPHTVRRPLTPSVSARPYDERLATAGPSGIAALK